MPQNILFEGRRGLRWAMLPTLSLLFIACSSSGDPDGEPTAGGSAGASVNAGASGASTGGAGSSSTAGSSTAGASTSGAGTGGASAAGTGGASAAGTGGATGGSGSFERATCLIESLKLCVDSYERDAGDFKASCVSETKGTVATKCPTEGLIGCCLVPAFADHGDTTRCIYTGNTGGPDQAACLDAGGTWSSTVPP